MPLGQSDRMVLFEYAAGVEVAVVVEVVVGGEGRPLSGSMRTLTASFRQLWVAESILGGCRPPQPTTVDSPSIWLRGVFFCGHRRRLGMSPARLKPICSDNAGPLVGVKETSPTRAQESANDPKRTLRDEGGTRRSRRYRRQTARRGRLGSDGELTAGQLTRHIRKALWTMIFVARLKQTSLTPPPKCPPMTRGRHPRQVRPM
jgi:hypothetical protein